MSAPNKLDQQTETQVVAMIARNDSYPKIVKWLKDEKGITMATKSIGSIKARNGQALEFMQSEIVKHETTMATTILSKSRRLIDHKLNRALRVDEELRELKRQLDSKEIEESDYYHRVDVALRSQLTVQELNALSKESFNQAQLEANKPTAISDSPAEAKQNLKVLLQAIANNDQEAMMKAIFLN